MKKITNGNRKSKMNENTKDEIPRKKRRKNKTAKENSLVTQEPKNCVICLNDEGNSEENHVWRTLNCKHFFHEECLKEWEQYNTCPICREVIDKNKPIKKLDYENDTSHDAEIAIECDRKQDYQEIELLLNALPLFLSPFGHFPSLHSSLRSSLERKNVDYGTCSFCQGPLEPLVLSSGPVYDVYKCTLCSELISLELAHSGVPDVD